MPEDESRDEIMTSVQEEEEEEQELMPFMDTFYSLASNEAKERSFAASSMIKYLFYKSEWEETSIDATVKDGSYALTRLMNGLCSGRGSARQGFASCLTTFLKCAFKMGPENESKERWIDMFVADAGVDTGAEEFVRNKLKECTNLEGGPAKGKKNTGKKSRSDERDYRFGRLFGILAIVRSGALAGASEKVIGGYVSDLLSLYEHKNWFREPTIHALQELFSSFSNQVDIDEFGKLVQNSVSAFFNFEKKAICPWSVEKIVLYLHLQTIYMDKNEGELPKCLKTPLLTVSNFDNDIGGEVMKLMLRDTSATVYPKVHLVWNSIWSYLSKESDGKQQLREVLIVGTDSAAEIIEALVNKVVVETLLGDEVEGQGFVNATPGRRALGLSVLQQLFALNLPSEIVQDVILQKPIVTNLFVNTLQKFSGGKKTHTLKPLALSVLQSIVDSLSSGPLDGESTMRRFGASKAFLKANPSFDNVTKTDTVAVLLGLENRTDSATDDNDDDDDGHSLLWEKHFAFVMEEINERLSAGEESLMEANKYIDILFAFVKRVFRVGNEAEKESIFQKVLSFFMIGAFFNLDKFIAKKRKGNEHKSLLQTACQLKANVGKVPFVARALMSSRFFSLISEYINASSFQQAEGAKESMKDKKIHAVLEVSSLVCDSIRILQKSGAILDCDLGKEAPVTVLGLMDSCKKMQGLVVDESGETDSKTRAVTALVGLASSLTLQMLQPGLPGDDNEDDDIDMEDEDISEDIMEMISDLSDVTNIVASDENSEEDTNVLDSLAEIFIGILSSSCGGSGLQASKIRGGASKITRDCLQTAWSAILATSSNSAIASLDADLMNTLLEAVCSQKVLEQGEEAESDEDMSDEEDSDDEDVSDMQLSFANATSAAMDSESENEEAENESVSDEISNTEDKGEIEVDSSKLENLLIQSSDDDDSVDGNMLEHHAGADAALAQLIMMKQEARKSGKDQKEKLELSNRLRCMALLEAMFLSNKRTGLLSNQVVLMSILPLLRSRTELAKSLSSGKSSQSDKKALLDKITVLLESKVAKTNVDGMANLDACKVVADQITIEMKKVQDVEHCKCCSALLVLLVKAVGKQGDESIAFATSVYDGFVPEWSTKKSTKLKALIFDDLAIKCQSIAKMVLTAPLIEGSKNARNAFLRTECFRILSTLYITQAPDEKSDVENEITALKKYAVDFTNNLADALRDEEMTKAKRAREIVKCAERLVKFANIHGDAAIWAGFEGLKAATHELLEKSESSAIQSICKKLESDIADGVKVYEEKIAAKKLESVKTPSSASKKKDKKKKKSKKKKA